MTKRYSASRNSLCGTDLNFFVEYDGTELSGSFLNFDLIHKTLKLLNYNHVESKNQRWRELFSTVETLRESSGWLIGKYFHLVWLWLHRLHYGGCFQLPEAVEKNKRVKIHAEVLADLFINRMSIAELKDRGCEIRIRKISCIDDKPFDAIVYPRSEPNEPVADEHGNINCENCENCENCKNCKNCKNCNACEDCVNCVNCKDCNYCEGCDGCFYYCVKCKNCNACEYCVVCKNCENCKDCTDCDNCTGCRDCIDTKDVNNEDETDEVAD